MSNRTTLLFAFILLSATIGYGFFQARTLMQGPTLVVTYPHNGAHIEGELFEISGSTKNVTHVFLNGRPVLLSTTGAFTETLATPEGYGVLLIEAKNRFGHHREARIEFFGTPKPNLTS